MYKLFPQHSFLFSAATFLILGTSAFSDEIKTIKEKLAAHPAVVGFTSVYPHITPCAILLDSNSRMFLASGRILTRINQERLYIKYWDGRVVLEKLTFKSEEKSGRLAANGGIGLEVYLYEIDTQLLEQKSVLNLEMASLKEADIDTLELNDSLAVVESVLNEVDLPRVGKSEVVSNGFIYTRDLAVEKRRSFCYIFPDDQGLAPMSMIFKSDKNAADKLRWIGVTLPHYPYECGTRMISAKTLFAWVHDKIEPDQSSKIIKLENPPNLARFVNINKDFIPPDDWVARSDNWLDKSSATLIHNAIVPLVADIGGGFSVPVLILEDQESNLFLALCDSIKGCLNDDTQLCLTARLPLIKLVEIMGDSGIGDFKTIMPGLAVFKINIGVVDESTVKSLRASSVKIKANSREYPINSYVMGPVSAVYSPLELSTAMYLRLPLPEEFDPHLMLDIPKHFSTCFVFQADHPNEFLGILSIRKENRHFCKAEDIAEKMLESFPSE